MRIEDWRGTKRHAAALSLAVVTAGHLSNLELIEPTSLAGHLSHIGADSVLAAPLAVFAVLAGRRAASLLGRAWLTAAMLELLLVPAARIHALMEPGLAHAGSEPSASSSETLLSFFVAMAVMACTGLRLRAVFTRPAIVGVALVVVATATVHVRPLPAAAAYEPFVSPLTIPPVITSDTTITMQEAEVQILPGAKTKMWTYNGIFPGPTLRRASGSPMNITFVNNLPLDAGAATVHHHGSHSRSSEDGQPNDQLITNGLSRTYSYDLRENGSPERAAFQWYHDHRMDVTGRNVWRGLAGMVILDDAVDSALPLPKGDYDVPLMVADRSFDANNQLSYTFNANGLRGTHLLVNGTAQPYFDVEPRKYRLRLLNAANLSSFTFELEGATMRQIATESGLLPSPVTRTTLRLGPAERAEVVVDFSGRDGSNISLFNREGFGSKLNTAMQFRVIKPLSGTDTSSVPATLRPLANPPVPSLVNTRLWVLGQTPTGELVWTINGKRFDSSRIDTAPLNPVLGTSERWIFVNTTGVDHLMHIHDVDWRLVRRYSATELEQGDALAEMGLKETFVVRPNEVVEVVSTFTDYLGKYVFHCHLLEHEDRAMMAQFEVTAR